MTIWNTSTVTITESFWERLADAFISSLPNLIVVFIAVVIAALSLYMTYFYNAKLIISVPRLFAVTKTKPSDPARVLGLELPLGFYNRAAKGKVILTMQLVLEQGNVISPPFHFTSTREDLAKGNEIWARPFVIEPRRGYSNIFGFALSKPRSEFMLSREIWKATLKYILVGSDTWDEPIIFNLDIAEGEDEMDMYQIFSNYPEEPAIQV
jgi:hypothetical protein